MSSVKLAQLKAKADLAGFAFIRSMREGKHRIDLEFAAQHARNEWMAALAEANSATAEPEPPTDGRARLIRTLERLAGQLRRAQEMTALNFGCSSELDDARTKTSALLFLIDNVRAQLEALTAEVS